MQKNRRVAINRPIYYKNYCLTLVCKFISIPHKKIFITDKKKNSSSSAQGLKVAATRMETKIGERIKEYEWDNEMRDRNNNINDLSLVLKLKKILEEYWKEET